MEKLRNEPFTLIEVLITMIIMTIVAALLIGAFHTGLMCYRKTDAYEKSALKLNGALSFLRNDIRRFVPIEDKAVSFKPRKMAFYIVSDKPESRLQLITYSVENNELKRSIKPYSAGTENSEAGNSSGIAILSGLDFWEFGYVNSKTPRKRKEDKNLHEIKPSMPVSKLGQKTEAKQKKNKLYWPSTVLLNGNLESKEKTQLVNTSVLMPLYNIPKTNRSESESAANPDEKKSVENNGHNENNENK